MSLQLVSTLNLIHANWPVKVKLLYGQMMAGESSFKTKGLHTEMKWAVRDWLVTWPVLVTAVNFLLA